jgi:hypothetical protein
MMITETMDCKLLVRRWYFIFTQLNQIKCRGLTLSFCTRRKKKQHARERDCHWVHTEPHHAACRILLSGWSV